MASGGCNNPDCKDWPDAICNKIVFYEPDNYGWFAMLRSPKDETFITAIAFCPWCGSKLTPPED